MQVGEYLDIKNFPYEKRLIGKLVLEGAEKNIKYN